MRLPIALRQRFFVYLRVPAWHCVFGPVVDRLHAPAAFAMLEGD
ncbi:hypothetical protein [Caballeronia sp. LZ065]|nr:hypothetical protein [Caballeronia sp. LZ065]